MSFYNTERYARSRPIATRLLCVNNTSAFSCSGLFEICESLLARGGLIPSALFPFSRIACSTSLVGLSTGALRCVAYRAMHCTFVFSLFVCLFQNAVSIDLGPWSQIVLEYLIEWDDFSKLEGLVVAAELPSSSCADMAKGKRQRRNADDESTESTGLVGMLEAET
jgi:hypothetical protein